MRYCDTLIIGAGIYGLYAAEQFAEKGHNVLVIECEKEPFLRASYINQARVHNGYHYPRSISTAVKSANYFRKFNQDYESAINTKFRKVYAMSKSFSFTNGAQFKKFCGYAGVKCKEIDPREYFNENTIDAAFETEEYAFDAFAIRDILLNNLSRYPNVNIEYETFIERQSVADDKYILEMNRGDTIETRFVLNTTYASVNQILNLFGFEMFKIKYEICEIALCKPNHALKDVGLTVMDGPFFSVMPFGLDGTFSLTSVTFTPHVTSYEKLPRFKCQEENPNCTTQYLDNCNLCKARPQSAWGFMYQLGRKYLNPEIDFYHTESLFAIKPILLASELDDSRPTVIREFRTNPRFVSVLSGKINTIYDLKEVF